MSVQLIYEKIHEICNQNVGLRQDLYRIVTQWQRQECWTYNLRSQWIGQAAFDNNCFKDPLANISRVGLKFSMSFTLNMVPKGFCTFQNIHKHNLFQVDFPWLTLSWTVSDPKIPFTEPHSLVFLSGNED